MNPDVICLLNPFSSRAREVLKNLPPLQSLPPQYVNRAVDRVLNPPLTLGFDRKFIEEDLLSFYLACLGVASVTSPYSPEAGLLEASVKKTVKHRLFELFRRGYSDICLQALSEFIKIEPISGRIVKGREIPEGDYFKLRDMELKRLGFLGKMVDERILLQCVPKYVVRWTDLAPLLRRSRAHLTDLYLIEGWAVISVSQLWDYYSEFIGVKVQEYLDEAHEKLSNMKPPPIFVQVGTEISRQVPKKAEMISVTPVGKLRPEFFPPCIKKSLLGCPAGYRNFAISMLLTSFLSYARIRPSGVDPKIKDFLTDLSPLTEEILPMIYAAAERCNPPLFSDQPHEKANIFYHLGFGLTLQPRLEDSGRSTWYKPPNCEKIKTQAPLLCEPDEFCARVRNPLTYYFRRLVEERYVQRSDSRGEENILH